MPRQPRRARLTPGFHLEEIVIQIPIGTTMPVVKLSGRTITGNPRLDAMSRVAVTTTILPPSGRSFIDEIEKMFAGQPKIETPSKTGQ